MIKLSLKSILNKKNETASVIVSLIEQLSAHVWIEDENGKVLLGSQGDAYTIERKVIVDNELFGVVKGNDKANIIADILSNSVQKEAEKKKLGSEVLNLYQEINLIYNFSERLAQTIDAPTISAITLEEAGRVIKSNGGVVVLWDEESQRLKILASSGELFFVEGKLYTEIR